MPYSDRDYKVSNVNYLNKDFNALKSTLIEYAKTYFPNSYRDFNETSPGMMLIEMGAYVGDVLSFYIDQQYKEMLLPLAEERRNVINLANAFGYKVKPTTPAFVDLSISQILPTTGDFNNRVPNYSNTVIIPAGTQVQSSNDSSLIFETLDVVDFNVSGSVITDNTRDENNMVVDFKLTKKVKAISAQTKTKTFTIGTPQKFLRLTLDETNVVDILSVKDTNGNEYYEVDYLVQDNVPIETYYTASSRGTPYNALDDSSVPPVITTVAVPYRLEFIRTSKKFITEINDDDTTSLVFGNGLLRNGQIQESALLSTEQVGLVIPGETQNFTQANDPLVSLDNRSTLGETPANTTLTVKYRIGGGVSSNVSVGDLTTFVTAPGGTTSVTNESPAYGGSDGQSVDEIREAAKAYFATQNRCVTQEDYEARTLAMPAKFGGIAKVFCDRDVVETFGTIEETQDYTNLETIQTNLEQLVTNNAGATPSELISLNSNLRSTLTSLSTQQISPDLIPATINLHILSYDENGKLVPPTNPRDGNNNVVLHPLKQNLINYLEQFRILTDEVNLIDGKIINFGVSFDVVAHKGANKVDVKVRVIDKIRDYFKTSKMQFRQPIYTNDIMYDVMGVDGVRSVNSLRLVQEFALANTTSDVLYNLNSQGVVVGGDPNYNYRYDFDKFYGNTALAGDGVILPSVEPSVFELKFPNRDIRGKVI